MPLRLISALFIALLGLSACETIEGAGQDISKAGQTISEESRETQDEM